MTIMTMNSMSSDGTSSDSGSEQGFHRIQVPLIGFGTFNNFEDHARVADAVKEAIRCGYRHFDLAKWYDNEIEVGAAIRECIEEGIVERDDLYICSKLWCDDHDPKDVQRALQGTLDRLGLEYIDNYMMHWPTAFKKGTCVRVANDLGGQVSYELEHCADEKAVLATYRAMEMLVRKGLARSIGVSNFDHIMLDSLLEHCKIRPLTLEVEMHPYLAQNSLLEYCRSQQIHVVAYCPIGKPGYKNADDPMLLEDPIVVSIATALNRTPGQVLLRWGVQRGVSVIPKSLNPTRIRSNYDILDWVLTQEEMNALNSLDRHHRFCVVPWFDFSLYDNRRDQPSRFCPPPSLELTTEAPVAPVAMPAHPKLPHQPLRKRGSTDSRGVYRNDFGRDGKRLHSDIFLKRGVIRHLRKYYHEILPAECLTAKNYVIVDEIVDKVLDVDTNFIAALKKEGVDCTKILIPADTADACGESSVERYKTADVLHSCTEEVLQGGLSKHSCIISVGGGVVNNLCGVMASMLYRGIGLVHFTTSTMGMLDAALDFKQAVNHSCGKNLLGSYYPASCVVIDPECVSSLSTRHVQNGIAEALKHAFCQSTAMLHRIVEPVRQRGEEAFRDSRYIEAICKDCIEVKAPTLDHYHSSDFNEMCPQYGHAVGHAIEFISWETDYPLLHGEAVAIGMCVSAEIARMRGLCTQDIVEQHYDACLTLGLPAFVPANITIPQILQKIVYDKHFVKCPAMGLCSDIGLMAINPEASEKPSTPAAVTDTSSTTSSELSKPEKVSFAFSIPIDELERALQANIDRRVLATPAVDATKAAIVAKETSTPVLSANTQAN